jgi:hypothetical protein
MRPTKISVLILSYALCISACHEATSPTSHLPAPWHKPKREYQPFDSVGFVVVDFKKVQRIRVGMTMAEIAAMVGTEPTDYYIHPEYALLCTAIDGKSFEVALRHGTGDKISGISFREIVEHH